MENEELTPSLKLAPNVVRKVFKAQIESLYDEDKPISEETYVIAME
jgi:DNA-binding XRE family transcriptional regulator